MNTQTPPSVVPGNSVKPSKTPLKTVSYEKALRHAIGNDPLEAYSRDTQSLLDPKLSGGYAHGFVAAVNAAYDRHYPLILSPDMIWLLIAQGFATHVRENAEGLRSKFIPHEGKAKLEVYRDTFVRGFAGNDWESVFSELSEQIRTHIGSEAHSSVTPTFSTTSLVEKAAFEVTLMDAMQEYFDYSVMTRCGIPEYYIEGTPADWKLLKDKAEGLKQFELDWWIASLMPFLEEFIAAAEGKPNPRFWQGFFKVRDQSGGPHIQGQSKRQSRIARCEQSPEAAPSRSPPTACRGRAAARRRGKPIRPGAARRPLPRSCRRRRPGRGGSRAGSRPSSR